ncbi:hypothetical protein BZG35_06730 [Brevundimonas sp. LM2]|uniref:hypothetical protein n=1 Tax=Brevundimonas sp. LM2 TaxID=1938605 RepID=UPI000983C5A2|nr:hypothetical protein [Brevundimonas sp. LM2]AQR61382.1 hypothetical protein BZG35_06730 [Brevundimonas sp. LM2]
MRAVVALSILLGAAAAGCAEEVKAPYDPGVCYALTLPADGEPVFNVVARDQTQIEFCAARLEEMRVRFLRLGGSTREVTGSYQGRFIFVDGRGVSYGSRLDGVRFFALARTGDGRLAVPQAIERETNGLSIIEEQAPPAFPAG